MQAVELHMGLVSEKNEVTIFMPEEKVDISLLGTAPETTLMVHDRVCVLDIKGPIPMKIAVQPNLGHAIASGNPVKITSMNAQFGYVMDVFRPNVVNQVALNIQ